MEIEKDRETLGRIRKSSRKKSFSEVINSRDLSSEELDELFLS